MMSTLRPGGGAGFEGLEHLRRSNFARLVGRIGDIRPLMGARLLEIGCGRGWFLDAAQRLGAIAKGVEPVVTDASLARAEGFDVEEGYFPHAPSDRGPYDVIVFNDVFEHLADPVAALGAIESILAAGGLLIINLPTSEGVLYRLANSLRLVGMRGPFDRLWQKSLPSPHMTYFSARNLRSLVERRTSLREVASMCLPTVSRRGLRSRVSGQSAGLPDWIVFPVVLGLSYLLPLLPSDIHVGFFRKPA